MLIESLILGIMILLLLREGNKYTSLSIRDTNTYRYKGLKLMGLGLLLNGLIVLFSGGSMWAEGTLIAHLGYNETYLALEKEVAGYHYITEQAKLSFLSDVIHLPPPYPYPKSTSYGDILIGLGIFLHLAFFETSRQVRAPTAKGGCVL